MTDMNVYATKIAQGSAQPQALAGASTGAAAKNAASGNFWDFILSGLTKSEQKADGLLQQAAAQTANSANLKDAAKPQDNNPLALLQIALANQTVDAQGNIVLPEDSATLEASLQKQLTLTDTIINQLKNVLPENNEQGGIFNQLLSKLQAKSDTLHASLAALEAGTISKDTPVEDIPFPLLTALGLNPAEIAKVAEDIQVLEEKLGRDVTIEDLIAGVGGILAPAPEVTTTIKTAALGKDSKIDVLSGINENTEPTDDLAAQLNALDVGGEEDLAKRNGVLPSAPKPASPVATAPIETPVTAPALTASEKSAARDALMGEGERTTPDTTEGKIKAETVSFKDTLVNTPAQAPANTSASFEVPASFFSMFETDASSTWSQLGLSVSPAATQLGTVAQAASLASSNAHAGQTHPATQMVSASMTRAGKDGNADTIQIQLDPPELGSVNVRLEFGKGKTVKAHLVVEKPETYLMLQRDGLALERALQNAGLDANSQSLSFELAQNGGNLNPDNNGQGGGENNLGGRGNSEETDDAVIQSTMTWQVDESTGHVRYNIYA